MQYVVTKTILRFGHVPKPIGGWQVWRQIDEESGGPYMNILVTRAKRGRLKREWQLLWNGEGFFENADLLHLRRNHLAALAWVGNEVGVMEP